MTQKAKARPNPTTASRPADAPTCSTCRHWQAVELGRPMACKRYPPIPLAGAGQVRPTPLSTDTCGEHRK